MSLTISKANYNAKLGADKSVQPLVMIVEDHADTRDMLRFVIETFGCLVVEAADGEEAVRLAEGRLPNLILMDTGLPGVDGYMATKQIRMLKDGTNVPIVFLTGYAEPQAHELALAAGGNDYLVKPVNLEELELSLGKHLMTATVHET